MKPDGVVGTCLPIGNKAVSRYIESPSVAIVIGSSDPAVYCISTTVDITIIFGGSVLHFKNGFVTIFIFQTEQVEKAGITFCCIKTVRAMLFVVFFWKEPTS